jgi:hypothetical protein
LPRGILAGARSANACGDLFPIGHVLACIVTAEAGVGQHRPSAAAAVEFTSILSIID